MSTQSLTVSIQAIARHLMAYPYRVWAFGESVGVKALWKAGQDLREPAYQGWVIDLLERWLRRDPPLEEADHNAPGAVLLDAYEANGQARYRDRALALADHLSRLPRGPSGAAYHRPTHPEFHHYIYVDCMAVDAPFFCRLAQITGQAVYYDTAVQELEGYCRLLQDPQTGLFYHQYNGETGMVNGAFWGRGNGWASLGLVETLALLPREHPGWGGLHQRWQRQAEALAGHQLPSGDWTTVIDLPSTYIESSTAALLCYAFGRGIEAGLLPDTYAPLVARAWEATRQHLSAEGVLRGVSVATPPGSADHYNRVPIDEVIGPWGQGSALLAALAQWTGD